MCAEYVTHAQRYLDLGYIPIPIQPNTKRPSVPRWQDTADNRDWVADYILGHPNDSLGLLTGEITALDGDILDTHVAKEVAQWVQSRFPSALPRVGARPKFLFLFGVDQIRSKRASAVFTDAEGRRHRLELLGKGQQFVAHGVHPQTNQPYLWPKGSPVDQSVCALDLPTFTEADWEEVQQVFEQACLARGFIRQQDGSDGAELSNDTPFPLAGLTLEDARDALEYVPNDDLEYDDYLSIGLALHQQSNGDREWFDVWDAWASTSSKNGGTAYNWQRWRSFDSSRGGGVTMRSVVRRAELAGWTRPEQVEGAMATTASAQGFEDLNCDGYPDLSHDALALMLGEAGGWNERARYVRGWGKWMFWTGSRWQRDEVLKHMTEVRNFLRQVGNRLEAVAEQRALHDPSEKAAKLRNRAKQDMKTLRQHPTAAAVEVTARSNEQLAAGVDQWDANLDVLGTPDGVVDLRTGALREGVQEDYVTKHTCVGPENRSPELWLSFLHTAMKGDAEMVRFLQVLCGYMLTGHTNEHKLPFLFGPGGNGKSVFANTLHNILSDYSARAPAEAFLASRGERHPTDLAGLQGARLVIGSELPAGRAWNESAIKDLTGGDPITARYMRQDFFTYTPQFTLLIVGNHQPSISTVDDAMRRRVLLIPFDAQIPEHQRDRDLAAKLEKEYGEILNWMVEGAIRWYVEGLVVPQSVINATQDYLESEDVLGQFIADELVPDPDADIPSGDLYARYTDWCQRHGGRAMSHRALSQSLKERGLAIQKTRGPRILIGFRLAPLKELNTAWM